MQLDKYIGRRIELIYLDSNGKLTQRVVTVRSVADGRACVYDADKRACRMLRLEGILAAQPAKGRRPA